MLVDLELIDTEKVNQFIPEKIPRIDKLTYSDFFRSHLVANLPCVITNITVGWNCSSEWVDNKGPNFQKLIEKYGEFEVPVSEFTSSDYSSSCKKLMPLQEYITYWKSENKSAKHGVSYLKDWHLRKHQPCDNFYSVPMYFASDWLNEYSIDNNIDDYMFVYMGPKGSWTPFHADVYSSFSWSANVVGKKRWLLFPPGEELKFANSFGNLPTNIETLLCSDHKCYEVIQNSGEGIFVPSGWFHQVYNLEDTISINHNWVNGANVHLMWKALKNNFHLVEKEIIEYKDTDGWSEHCQIMLQALFGINYDGFVDFIKYIAEKRIQSIAKGFQVKFDKWGFGQNHIIYDLRSINEILQLLIYESGINESKVTILKKIIEDIKTILLTTDNLNK